MNSGVQQAMEALGVTEHRPGWFERLLGWRDRLLGSAAFQRWAADFPLTRPIADRRARALFDLCAGFVYSQVLFACVRLRLLEHLRETPQSITMLANKLALTVSATRRLIDSASALKLVESRPHDLIGLGPHGAALLGNPAAMAMIEHHHMLYADLQDPVALLRGNGQATQLARYWPYAGSTEPARLDHAQTADYTTLMSSSQPLVADDILDAYALSGSLHGHQRMLDVGGGDGSFLLSAAARAPHLHCRLFDLPAVAARAQLRFAAAGVAERCAAIGGNFQSDPLPEGMDLISLVRVVHDHDDATVLKLLRAAHRALVPGGTLMIAEPLAGTSGDQAMLNAYFGFYLLAMGNGRLRSRAELEELLREAGFSWVRQIRTRRPVQTGLLIAHRGVNLT